MAWKIGSLVIVCVIIGLLIMPLAQAVSLGMITICRKFFGGKSDV